MIMEKILSVVTSIPFIVLSVVAGTIFLCTLYVHFRGKTRLRFERQLTEHSGWLSPLNCLFYLFSAVPKDPVLPVELFPELAPIKENWKVLREEALALWEAGKIEYRDEHMDLAFLAFKKLGWKRYYLNWYHDYFPSALETCPKTIEIIRKIPGLNAAAFTMLPPGGHLGKHRDPLASALRYHLALVAPNDPGCRLFVDGQPVVWMEGEDFVFDETYVHWAENTTDQPRIVFFADFTRPMYPGPVRWLNNFLVRYVYGMTRSRNELSESEGLFGKVTPALHVLKKFFRGIKERVNRKAYYTVKYILFGGLLFMLLRSFA
jgi:beta-hydroxylase